MTKIYSIKDAYPIKKCSMVYGHFSSLHHGHIRYLKYAKQQAESLILVLMGDNPKLEKVKLQFKQKERAATLIHLDIVDHIILLEGDELELAVNIVNPKVLIFGKECEKEQTQNIKSAIKVHKSKKKEILFHAGEITYSSTNLLDNSLNRIQKDRYKQFRESISRQSLNLEILLSALEKWESTKIIVIGDTIIDQYLACEPLGLSSEAPVIVVKEMNYKNFLGGASIVASHINALGAEAKYISVIGEDDIGKYTHEELNKKGIKTFLIEDKTRPTTFKKRYMVDNQKIFRVSRIEEKKINANIEKKIIKILKENIPISDGIVISDFVYGVITPRILKVIIDLATKHQIPLFGDLQCSSQIGSVTKFKKFTLICPNEKEARVALQDKESGLEVIAQKIIKETNTANLLMKLSHEGFLIYDCNDKTKIIRQSFPALSVNPLDVAGAGDSLLAVMATGMSSKQSIMISAALGCCMAGIAVQNMGNRSINKSQIREKLIEILN